MKKIVVVNTKQPTVLCHKFKNDFAIMIVNKHEKQKQTFNNSATLLCRLAPAEL